MTDEIWWASTIEAELSHDRELSDPEIDTLMTLDGAVVSGGRGRCGVIFSVSGADPEGAFAEGYRRWKGAAPDDAAVDLVEIMTADRQGSAFE